jgi:hypothetical protein
MWEIVTGRTPYSDLELGSRALMKAVYHGKRPFFPDSVPASYRCGQTALLALRGRPRRRPRRASQAAAAPPHAALPCQTCALPCVSSAGRNLAACCWSGDPTLRPSAAALVKLLRQQLEALKQQGAPGDGAAAVRGGAAA